MFSLFFISAKLDINKDTNTLSSIWFIKYYVRSVQFLIVFYLNQKRNVKYIVRIVKNMCNEFQGKKKRSPSYFKKLRFNWKFFFFRLIT